ncbi:cold shock domain-containing protein [Gordonia sp. OPL2]|nr:cold shock domain-containing protein [Gordonia sp. OPL2]
MPTKGTVQIWHQQSGWGVIESDVAPHTCYATSISLRVEAVADVAASPLLGLRPGTAVEFEFSAAEPPIQGCDQIAHLVWPAGAAAPEPRRAAYSGNLWNSVGEPGSDGLTTMRQVVIDPTDIPSVLPPDLPTTIGTVRLWHDEEGWGVLDSDATPGGAWAHFSEVAGKGFRTLTPGQVVEFDYENHGQDGYNFRANNIRGQ